MSNAFILNLIRMHGQIQDMLERTVKACDCEDPMESEKRKAVVKDAKGLLQRMPPRGWYESIIGNPELSTETLFRMPRLIAVGHGWLIIGASAPEEADGFVEFDLLDGMSAASGDRMGLPFTLMKDETRQTHSLNLEQIGGVIIDFAEEVMAYKGLSDRIGIHSVRFTIQRRTDPAQAAIFEPLLRAQEQRRQLLAAELTLLRNPDLKI